MIVLNYGANVTDIFNMMYHLCRFIIKKYFSRSRKLEANFSRMTW